MYIPLDNSLVWNKKQAIKHKNDSEPKTRLSDIYIYYKYIENGKSESLK